MKTHILILIAACSLLIIAHPSFGQGTAFTHQGQLESNGSPANGTYDIRSSLWSAMSGGTQTGSYVTNSAVAVSNGLFSVVVSFGNVFTGTTYWLETDVRTNGVGASFTTLSPRQQLTPTPYAIFAEGASNVSGVVPSGGLSGTYSGAVTFNNLGDSFTGNGGNLTGLNATQLTGGTVPNAALGNAWKTTGNTGTVPGVNFLGTTDNEGLIIKVDGFPAFIVAPALTDEPNIIGGCSSNTVNPIGRIFPAADTIAGGGAPSLPNSVTGYGGTVGGGIGNSADTEATVPGGYNNTASGANSFAAGQSAQALHLGAFVWADSETGTFSSTANDQFLIRADGGVGIDTANTVEGSMTLNTNIYMDDHPIYFRGRSGLDHNHGLAYCGTGATNFPNPAVLPDGPVLWGYTGGALGVLNGGAQAVLSWNNAAVTVPGTLNAGVLNVTGGADVAEPFEMSNQRIAAGSVVVIDAEHPGKLKLSAEPYDSHVAGVVSGANGVNPGISLRQRDTMDGEQNVALTGRVYVRATASNGPIRPGDLLTTSAFAGRAMKVIDHARAQGAILGKAMTKLDDGDGLVLVLVSLQ
jgi:hypothetical protein